MATTWRRRSFITRGADPTVVVIWESNQFAITEFQNIYLVESRGEKHGVAIDPIDPIDSPNRASIYAHTLSMRGSINILGEALHKALEDKWNLQNDMNAMEREAAEREAMEESFAK